MSHISVYIDSGLLNGKYVQTLLSECGIKFDTLGSPVKRCVGGDVVGYGYIDKPNGVAEKLKKYPAVVDVFID